MCTSGVACLLVCLNALSEITGTRVVFHGWLLIVMDSQKATTQLVISLMSTMWPCTHSMFLIIVRGIPSLHQTRTAAILGLPIMTTTWLFDMSDLSIKPVRLCALAILVESSCIYHNITTTMYFYLKSSLLVQALPTCVHCTPQHNGLLALNAVVFCCGDR